MRRGWCGEAGKADAEKRILGLGKKLILPGERLRCGSALRSGIISPIETSLTAESRIKHGFPFPWTCSA